MGQSREGRRGELAPARRMAASHYHNERILEQRCGRETLAWTVRAAERQIEIADIQTVDKVQSSAGAQVEADRRRRGRHRGDQEWGAHDRAAGGSRKRKA